MANKDKHGKERNECHLLALPAELRTMIFEYATTEQNPIRIKLWTKIGNVPGHDSVELIKKDNRIQPALAMTCRAIRDECLPIFFKRNVFRLINHQVPLGNWPLSTDLPSLGATEEDFKRMACVELEKCGYGSHLHVNLKQKGDTPTAEVEERLVGCERCGDSPFKPCAVNAAKAIFAVYRGRARFTEALLKLIMRNS